jgi:hypothetical protein
VEFLNYKAAVAELRPSGLVEIVEETPGSSERDATTLVRFTLEPNAKAVKAVHSAAIGAPNALRACVDEVDETTSIPSAEPLAQLVEDVLHKHKVTEALVIPVGKWRAISDLLALELADDQSWQDIDAEASLHLNSRDPLFLTTRDFHVIPRMLEALRRAAPDDASGEHDLSVVAAGVGLVLEFRPSGAVLMIATNPSFCAELAGMV